MRVVNESGLIVDVTAEHGRYLLTRPEFSPAPEIYSKEPPTMKRERGRMALVTAFHGRERLTRMFADYYNRTWSGPMVAAYTGQVPDVGWTGEFVEHENIVSNKFNAAAKFARALDVDAIMIVGSDDLVSESYIVECERLLLAGYDYIAASSVYMYDEASGRAMHVPVTGSAGCGRVLSRELLDKMHWTPYVAGKMRAIDSSMSDKIERINPPGSIIDISPGRGMCILDYKCVEGVNIWRYDKFSSMTDVTTVDASILDQFGINASNRELVTNGA